MSDLDRLIETVERLTKALEAHNNLHPFNSGYFPAYPGKREGWPWNSPQCSCDQQQALDKPLATFIQGLLK